MSLAPGLFGDARLVEVVVSKTVASKPTSNQFAQAISAFAVIAASIVTMIMGACALGTIVGCLGAFVSHSVEPEAPGARAFVEQDRGRAPVLSGDLLEARSVWIDRQASESPR